MTNKKLLSAVFALFIGLCLCIPANALDVKRRVLPNGLAVQAVERRNIPVVTVSLLIKAGQPDEPPEKAGLSNLTARLLTSGTKTRTATQISEETEFIGASLGASAGADFIVVSLTVLKKDILKGFELLGDILLNPVFPEDEIKRERDLITGGLRQSEEDPFFLAERAFKKEVYGQYPYGRLVSGSVETLSRIERQNLVKFHGDFFRPNNAILTVAGDIGEEELIGLIKRFMDTWQRKDMPPGKPVPVQPRVKRLVKIDKDLTQANIILGHLGVSRDNPDYYAIQVMNYILGGGGFSSRLMDTIRDRMGLAYDVHSFFAPQKGPGVFQVGAQTKNESANTVIAEILKELKKIREETVTEEELEDAKSYLKGSFALRLDTMARIAEFLGLVEFYGLGADYMEKYTGYIDAVSVEDVGRVAERYLDPDNLVLVVVADQKKADVKDR